MPHLAIWKVINNTECLFNQNRNDIRSGSLLGHQANHQSLCGNQHRHHHPRKSNWMETQGEFQYLNFE